MRRLAVLLGAALLLSCGSSGSATSSAGGAPPASDVTLTSQPYTLQPGEEKFYCYAMTLDHDVVATGFTPTYGKATHHILFAEPLSPEPDGFTECNVLFKPTWAPLYVGGVDTSPLQLPQGTGMKLTAGTQILLQLHLLNAGSTPVTDSTGVTMHVAADPTAPFTPAGIFGMDDRNIDVPAGATGFTESMQCAVNKQLNVFAVFGHMHRIGTHINLTRNAGDTLYDAPWTFDLQPTTPMVMTINPADQLKLTCTYANPGTSAVTYGESTTNEMCAFVFYYTPFDGLDGCVQQ